MIRQPKYEFGQEVVVEIETEEPKTKLKFLNKTKLFITTISRLSDEDDFYYNYWLTTKLPDAYSYGDEAKICRSEKELSLLNPFKPYIDLKSSPL